MRLRAAVVVFVLSGPIVSGASAQDLKAVANAPVQMKEVTAGPEYAAGARKRKVLGTGYRDLWTTPFRVEVLDLQKEGGGLTPVRQVGQAQTPGLALQGADGRAYTFRSLHKEPERMLPPGLREGVPGYIVRDMTSNTHPAAGVVFAALSEAAGVPHVWPRLVVMPDDPALGQFQKAFANQVGTIEEYPLPPSAGTPGFMGATEIISSTAMWRKWMEGPENRLDSRAYLRARVIELLVDNYDRHRGQWRWMKLPGKDAWQPLPEDPDFVFIHRDGLMMATIRRRVPQFLEFSGKYPGRLDGALNNGAEMDRWLFADLTAADFEAVARDVQSNLNDAVFEQALRRMPPEWYAIDAQHTGSSLRARLPGLVTYVGRVYRYHAEKVDVQATDRAERVSIARAADNSVEVTIGLADEGAAPYYSRRFLPSETREVRIFLHGGDDRVERSGPAGGPITVRVVAGGGRDVVDDSKSGGTDVWRDSGTLKVERGPGTNVRDTPWFNPAPVKDAPWIEPRSFSHWTFGTPLLGYGPDVLVYLGYGLMRTSYGFRTLPNKSEQTIQGAFATGVVAGQLEYTGTFRRPGTGLGYQLHTYASGLKSYNYFGAGNDTPQVADRNVYKTREDVVSFAPAIRWEAGRRWEIHGGADVRYSRTPDDPTTIVAAQAPVGAGNFGLLGLHTGVSFDSREEQVPAVKADVTNISTPFGEEPRISGVRFQATGFVVPKAWDVRSQYGGFDGFVTAYAGGTRAHVAMRVGGRRLWGDYAWFDAAYIGGPNDRGYNNHRFAGDASLYGNASLHAWLGTIHNGVIPVRMGLVTFADVGRVWLAGEDSNTWHPSLGAGMLAQPVGVPLMVNFLVAYSKEATRFYFGFGYPF